MNREIEVAALKLAESHLRREKYRRMLTEDHPVFRHEANLHDRRFAALRDAVAAGYDTIDRQQMLLNAMAPYETQAEGLAVLSASFILEVLADVDEKEEGGRRSVGENWSGKC